MPLLTREPLPVVLADEVDGGVDHVEGDVEAVAGLAADTVGLLRGQAVAGDVQEPDQAGPCPFHRFAGKN